MGRDITSTFNAWSYDLSDRMIEVFQQTGNDIPTNSLEITLPKFIVGASHKFNLPKDLSATVALDLDITTDRKRNVLISGNPFSIDPHFGVELGYNNLIFVRGGFGNLQQESDFLRDNFWSYQFNVGVGVIIKKILAIDYALSDIGDKSIAVYSNIFSLKLFLNRSESKKEASSF
jgi:hypothetical protein